MITKFSTLSLLGGLFLAPAAFSLDVAGEWLTQAGTAKVQIDDCGDGTPCGSVTWLEDEDATSGTDVNNPDPELRDRPLIGLPLLYGFEQRREEWRGGNIYDPESGKTYGSRLKLKDDGTLQVKGCVGPVCQTQIWNPTN